MASFVEQAELLVTDKSSSNIRKINTELNRLYKTASKLQKLGGRGELFGIKTSQLSKARRDIQGLGRDVERLRGKKVDLNVNSRTLLTARTRLETLRKDAAKGVNVRVNKTGTVRPSAPEAAFLPNSQTFGARIAGSFANAAAHHAIDIGRRIGRAAVESMKEGVTLRDVAESKLTLQGITKEQRGAVAGAAQELVSTAPFAGAGRVEDLLAELLGVTRGNLPQAQMLAKETLRVAKVRVSQGMTADTALESAVTLSKAGEQTGAITDVQGNIDAERTRAFFDLMLRGQVMVGKELNDSLVKSLFKSLRTAKFTLSDRGTLTALGLAEELGSSAGVGINQMIKQLSGERIQKKQLAQLKEYGLITGTKEVKTGTSGGKKTTTTVSAGAVDESLLRSDPVAWVEKYVIPVMEKQGFDPNNAVSAASFAGSVTSERTATDTLTALILRYQELRKQIDRAQSLNLSDATINQLDQSSVLLATQSTIEQFISLMGEVGHSFESILIPALQGVASAMQGLAEFIAGPTGEGSKARSAVVAGGGLAVGAAALFGGKKLIDLLNPLTGSATALSGSAVALDGSAAALTEAAIALGASGKKPSFGRDGDLGGGGKKGSDFSQKRTAGKGAVAGLLLADAVLNMPSTTEEIKANWDRAEEVSKSIETNFTNIVKGLGLSGVQQSIKDWRDSTVSLVTGKQPETRANLTARVQTLEEKLVGLQEGRNKKIVERQLAETENKITSLDIRDYASAANITDAFDTGVTNFRSVVPELEGAASIFATEAPMSIKNALSEGGQMVAAAIRASLAEGVRVNTILGEPPPDMGDTAVAE